MHITPAQARVAFERLTHYGPGYTVEVAWYWIDVHKEVDLFFVEGEAWPVQYQPHCSQVSRLSVLIVKVMFRIFFHTDLTYYDHMPGVKDLNVSFYSFLFQTIFLHCIEQHEGEVIFNNFWGQVVKYFRVGRLCWSTLSTLHKSFARSIRKCKSLFFPRVCNHQGSKVSAAFQHGGQLQGRGHRLHQVRLNLSTTILCVSSDAEKMLLCEHQKCKLSTFKNLICRHNGRGELVRLNWSHFARDSHLDAPIDQVGKL